MPIILNEGSIAQVLRELVAHLSGGNLDQAQAALETMEFERLLRPVKDRSKGSHQFFDPSEEFGPERVHQSGDHLRECLSAIQREDNGRALHEAEAAAARWGLTER